MSRESRRPRWSRCWCHCCGSENRKHRGRGIGSPRRSMTCRVWWSAPLTNGLAGSLSRHAPLRFNRVKTGSPQGKDAERNGHDQFKEQGPDPATQGPVATICPTASLMMISAISRRAATTASRQRRGYSDAGARPCNRGSPIGMPWAESRPARRGLDLKLGGSNRRQAVTKLEDRSMRSEHCDRPRIYGSNLDPKIRMK